MNSSTDYIGTIWYFEDDIATAQMVTEYLEQSHFQVIHFDRFPKGGRAYLKDLLTENPTAVLLDVDMPMMDGYQICEQLRDDFLSPSIPIIFTSGLMQDEEVMKAFSVGADDYLIKPLRLNELLIKIQNLQRQKKALADSVESSSTSMKMAFSAMKTSSELGRIIRFQEEIHQVTTYQQLAGAVFKVLREFDLTSTMVVFQSDSLFYCRDDGQELELELQSIRSARRKGRLYSWREYSFFNYELFTVLVRNMPTADIERYGILKDQLCLLLNGVDARIKSMEVARSNEEKQRRIKLTSQVLANMVLEMEQSNIEFAHKFESIIQDMDTNVRSEIVNFNLLEQEEHTLLAMISAAMQSATLLFEQSIETEQQRKTIMRELLSKLAG